jgi:hypothetical protein
LTSDETTSKNESGCGLQGAHVMALIGQGEPARMAQHVRMRFERQPSGSTGALDHAREPGGSERRSAL